MKKAVGFIVIFIFLATLAYAQDIEILFPEDGVTYGPWSDTYFFFPRTESNAHNIIPNLLINTETIAYYQMWWNGNINKDSVGEIVNYSSTDTSGRQLVGPYKAMHNLTVIGFDEDNNVIDSDTAIFFLAINIEDYYEILEEGSEFLAETPISAEDLEKIQVSKEIYEQSTDAFTIQKTFTYITAKEKLTDEIQNHTKVKITIIPKSIINEMTLYSLIPKNVVDNVNLLILTEDFMVINPDPLMAWHFADVSAEKELEYHIQGHIREDDLKEIKAIPITTEKQKSALYYLIPIFIIPIVLFLLIYFSRFHKRGG